MTFNKLTQLRHVAASCSKERLQQGADMEFVDALKKILTDQGGLKGLTRRQTYQVLKWCREFQPEPMEQIVERFAALAD